jgi:non-homologous end joining protein Ku
MRPAKVGCWALTREGSGAMRAIWKGAVSFGLVSIGVKLYSATEEKDIRFHQVHRSDGGRIKYKRTCAVCGEGSVTTTSPRGMTSAVARW